MYRGEGESFSVQLNGKQYLMLPALGSHKGH